MNASDSCHMSHLCVCMYMSHVYDTSNSKQLDAIVDQYLKFIKSLSVDTYTDTLLFWKINGNRFKELEPLAKKVLGVQASEAAVERMFSFSGHILSCQRRRTGIKLFTELVLLKLNENL